MIERKDLPNNPDLIESILKVEGWLSLEEGLLLYHLAQINFRGLKALGILAFWARQACLAGRQVFSLVENGFHTPKLREFYTD